jgi:hypothetical protein
MLKVKVTEEQHSHALKNLAVIFKYLLPLLNKIQEYVWFNKDLKDIEIIQEYSSMDEFIRYSYYKKFFLMYQLVKELDDNWSYFLEYISDNEKVISQYDSTFNIDNMLFNLNESANESKNMMGLNINEFKVKPIQKVALIINTDYKEHVKSIIQIIESNNKSVYIDNKTTKEILYKWVNFEESFHSLCEHFIHFAYNDSKIDSNFIQRFFLKNKVHINASLCQLFMISNNDTYKLSQKVADFYKGTESDIKNKEAVIFIQNSPLNYLEIIKQIG